MNNTQNILKNAQTQLNFPLLFQKYENMLTSLEQSFLSSNSPSKIL